MNALQEDDSPVELDSSKEGEGQDDSGDLWDFGSPTADDAEPELVVEPSEGNGKPRDPVEDA